MREFAPAVASDVVKCPVCGSLRFDLVTEAGDYEYELPGAFAVSQCRECALLLQNPRPPFEQILRYYTERYEPYNSVGSSLVRHIRDFVLVRPRIAMYQRLIGRNGSIVDVGCATGALLNDLKRNGDWRLTGVEPHHEAARIASDSGLSVINAVLEEARLPDAAFDLVVMNHVLEHLPNPSLTVEHVHRVLKLGGFFAGEIPTPGCMERRIFGKYWGGYHLPRHLTFFGRQQIARFLREHGFDDIRMHGTIQPSNWLLSFSNFLHAKKSPLWLRRFFSPHSFIWLVLSTPVSIMFGLAGSHPILRFSARKAKR